MVNIKSMICTFEILINNLKGNLVLISPRFGIIPQASSHLTIKNLHNIASHAAA